GRFDAPRIHVSYFRPGDIPAETNRVLSGGKMKRRTLSTCFAVCLLALLSATAAMAQDATIVGTISDPSGAPVPDVVLTITNGETGQVRHITGNNLGQYVAPDLQIGRYAIRAEAPGFKAAEQKDVALRVGDRARID